MLKLEAKTKTKTKITNQLGQNNSHAKIDKQ